MLNFVTTTERPDLVETTGRWRWEAFFVDSELSLEKMLAIEAECASADQPIPRVFVLLKEGIAIGMVALCFDDLEGRPEVNPWLAGLYIESSQRDHGYALLLIEHVEQRARENGVKQLSLYTSEAVGLYRKAGWEEFEHFQRHEKKFSIMRKTLG